MTRKFQIIVSASAASVMVFSALAQDASDSKIDARVRTHDHAPLTKRSNRLNETAKASDVIGMAVLNKQDEKLGKVDDFAVDLESGRIVQVILSRGGLLGIGDRLTAVPPGALCGDAARKVLRLDANKDKLRGAVAFEMANWAENSDSNHLSTVYRYYGEEPAFTFVQNGEVIDQDHVASARQGLIPASRLGNVRKASKLMGASVKNLQDEKLGSVENLLVDLPSGRVVAVIVSSGGFLGIGDELSAVPPSAFSYTADRETLQLDTSKETLAAAPHFNANQWPDFAQPDYTTGVYRAYKVEPYFAADADNSSRNVRDRAGRTLTPLDQGNNVADLKTTALIRKEIIAGKDMSVNARNVKIITIDGRVTLRGPVNTAVEKQAIGEIADRIARSENVDNQLEVKATAGKSE